MARITHKTFKKAVINSGGNQSRIAERLEVTRSAIGHFLKKPRQKGMRMLLNEEAEKVIDIAEDNITTSIMVHKNVDDSKWLLTNSKRGKNKGYGAKQELEHSGERPHTFNLIVKSVEEIKSDKLDNQPKTA